MLRLLTTWVTPKSVGAEGVEGAIGKPPPRLRRGEIPCVMNAIYDGIAEI